MCAEDLNIDATITKPLYTNIYKILKNNNEQIKTSYRKLKSAAMLQIFTSRPYLGNVTTTTIYSHYIIILLSINHGEKIRMLVCPSYRENLGGY